MPDRIVSEPSDIAYQPGGVPNNAFVISNKPKAVNGVQATGQPAGAAATLAGTGPDGFTLTAASLTDAKLTGTTTVNGVQLSPTAQSATAVAVATAGTVATASLGVSRVKPVAAVTAVVLAPGTQVGQRVIVLNEAIAADSVTFNVAGTSNVADGVSSVIAGLTAASFVWDSVTSLWYRVG